MPKVERPPEQTTSTAADWQLQLQELVNTSSSTNRVALVSVGHPLRGDDYVGSYILKGIMKRTSRFVRESVYLFDSEDDLETLIPKVSAVDPRFVIFIDACEMQAKPGEAQLLPVAETSYPFFTTHGIPLKVLAEKLLPNSEVWVLAIQPEQTEFGAEHLSPEVLDAAVSISEFIAKILEDATIADQP